MTQGSESVPSASSSRPAADSVLDRFERWARDTPKARAVTAVPGSLTYGELDVRANRLARHLLAAGLPPGGLVAIGTARQTEIVVALLATLKAGGTYVVLDVEASGSGPRRLATLEPFAVLTHAAHQARLDEGRDLRFIRLGAEAGAIAERPAEPPARTRAPDALLQFTGAAQPRAVALTHTLLLAAHEAWEAVARPTPEDRHLITTGSDVTAFTTGWTRALCSGGTLVLPDRGPWTPDTVRAAVGTERVTVVHTDPAGAAHLLLPERETLRDARPGAPLPRQDDDAVRSVRLLHIAGDRLHLDQQAALQARLRPGGRVLNVYGSTETAGIGTWFELSQLPGPLDAPEELSLIGTPFPGCRAELRDGQLYLGPPGGGDAIPAGDLAHARPDGLWEFGGRIRDRIHLDGHPFDPHPLEALIRSHEHIGAALVAEIEVGRGVRRLVAYLCPPPGGGTWLPGGDLPGSDQLRDHLRGKVPEARIPRTVVRLRALPRNAAGQEDRAALPRPPRLTDPAAPVRRAGGKYSPATGGSEFPIGCAIGCGSLVLGVMALIFTDVIWSGSTELAGIPAPWAPLFFVLYLCECLAFGAGLMFLFSGRPRMREQGRGAGLTTAAHLAVVYLLVAWWPQDNLYRLAAKHDWPRQAALVYAFNIPLMIAGAVVVAYLIRKPASAFDFDD
ncbi:AMP-binding protein [Streptomyces sp. H27-G5]|uniref:AMP-binding protein n=1 Tax=Streptomyces sp. H27-G5 TaxID=2996698 RepID=UPI00226DD15B|nr:AMP-binding protein [Streptomyces sp. H27-G5]MCY0920971.1 AMP-binding protein [Streptomyces sp. H27-G5]